MDALFGRNITDEKAAVGASVFNLTCFANERLALLKS